MAKALFCLHKEINKNNSKSSFLSVCFSDYPDCGGVSGILKNKICLFFFFFWHGLIILILRMRVWNQNIEEFCFSLALGWVGQVVSKTCCDYNFQEVPLADFADTWISKSLITPILKNAHFWQTTNWERILPPIPVLQVKWGRAATL